MKKLILPVFFAAFIFSSCGKSDKNCTLTSASLQGSYKISSIKYKGSSTQAETEVLNTGLFLPACEVDNIFSFNNNGTYTYTDAGVVCNPNSSDAGVWSVSGNTLTVDGDATPVTNFGCSSFQITEYDSFQNGDITVLTFARQ
ncbi:MAG: lipocalin family protein [Ferruginibacter sp.]